eukprot:maker-scaffold28_size608977-snap-gene-1.19 protein:Tk05739 transcript:maker-scaffold28_size608977-snap-gene-1.19-mRNA-1 annotation:"AGAP010394-PA"
MGCRMIDNFLKRMFYKLGHFIGEHPGYFIIIPILLTKLCASGFYFMDYQYDPEYLFSPTHGAAKLEREVLEAHFPTNYSQFKSSRISRVGKFARLVIAPKDGGSILRSSLWNQMIYLDQIVYNVTVSFEGQNYQYQDVCARWAGYCYDNEILRLADLIPQVEQGQINLTYPLYFNPYDFETVTMAAFLGGVEHGEDHIIKDAKAMSLAYFLDVSEDWMVTVGDDWERQLLEDVSNLSATYAPDLEIGRFVSNTPAWEMEKSRLSVTNILIINVIAMIIFSFGAALMSDNVRSKPVIGFSGLLSAGMATIAAFGFACFIGVEFISLNMAAPFLLLGIGIDDTFVMLSSWRRSSGHLTVPERMGRCYSDAAVSITVTSLTDFLSFMAGAVTPFPSVRIFCLFTGISVAFIYIWHCTFFGAILALSGYGEKKNLHSICCCIKATPSSQALNRNFLFRWFMTGGINPDDPHNPRDNRDHAGMVFFRDVFGKFLTKTWVKSLVLCLFGVYIVIACWGVTNLKEGLEKRNTANYDSYSVSYYDMEDLYFKKYAFTISLMFTGPNINFADVRTQQKIENITRMFEDSVYIDGSVTQSWLRDFLDYISRNGGTPDFDLSIDTEQKFATILREVYVADTDNPLSLDVEYTKDFSRVKSARFLIQGHNIKNSYMEQQMVMELRDICNRFSTDEMQIAVFQPFFIYIDQYLDIKPQTIQCVVATAIIMIIVSLLLIPSVVSSLWISFSIISIEVGVVGFMTWWGVSLDGVALINLIMCIGFSVDFSAHICYHYIAEDGKLPDDRIRGSLYGLGIPIVQGALSTVVGVAGLGFAPSYLFVTFFKMIFLVIVLGVVHGLVLLPVLLSLFGPTSCKSRSQKSSRSSGLSTPTTISCHLQQPSCYTVNLGFVSDQISPSPMMPIHPLHNQGKPRGRSRGHNELDFHHFPTTNDHLGHVPSSRSSSGDRSRRSRSDTRSSRDRSRDQLEYVSTLPQGYMMEYKTSTPRVRHTIVIDSEPAPMRSPRRDAGRAESKSPRKS